MTDHQDQLDVALDRALAKTLQGPSLPPGFRTRLLEAQSGSSWRTCAWSSWAFGGGPW
jgi:hypothetical protein